MEYIPRKMVNPRDIAGGTAEEECTDYNIDLSLHSHPKEFWGNGLRTHPKSKGKIPPYPMLPIHIYQHLQPMCCHKHRTRTAPPPSPPPPPPDSFHDQEPQSSITDQLIWCLGSCSCCGPCRTSHAQAGALTRHEVFGFQFVLVSCCSWFEPFFLLCSPHFHDQTLILQVIQKLWKAEGMANERGYAGLIMHMVRCRKTHHYKMNKDSKTVSMHVYAHACIHVHVRMRMCTRAHTHTHTHKHKHTHMHVHAHVCTHTNTHTYTHTNTYTHTHMLTYMSTSTCIPINTHSHRHVNTTLSKPNHWSMQTNWPLG